MHISSARNIPHRWAVVVIMLLLALLVPAAAMAQNGCTVTVGDGRIIAGSGCIVVTATPAKSPTRTPTLAPTRTPVPPTATPTATRTPVPTVQVSGAYTVNVPLLLDAMSGDSRLNYNNLSSIWTGDISPDGGYAQARMIGRSDGLMVYVQQLAPTTTQPVQMIINGIDVSLRYGDSSGWEYTQRGSRGWGGFRVIPWATLGGVPQAGATWPLVFASDGDAWRGTLHWGLPDYAGTGAPGAQVLEVKLSDDATVGGGTNCGSDDWPGYYDTWGARNEDGPSATAPRVQMGLSAQVNAGQNQNDIADWPCYARYYAAWSLAELPAGAQVVSATVEMRQFGNPGYGANYTVDGPQDTRYEVFEVADPWNEAGITWDNAPSPRENVAWTVVRPIPDWCNGFCNPGIPYQFDVTEIVKRAQAAGRSWASMALYTSSGDYHSGKYFWAKGSQEEPVVRIAYTLDGTPTWTATTTPVPPTATVIAATPTAPAPTSTSTPRPPAPSSTPTLNATPSPTPTPQPSTGRTYYVGLNGSDTNSGTQAAPYKTFSKALAVMAPGDTLLVMDGVYKQNIYGAKSGQAGKPITIKALNDGQATIDGGGTGFPILLEGSYYVIDGLVARNGGENVIKVTGNNNTLRRVSAYNASPDKNSQVVLLWSDNNLIEDALIAGTGRYMLDIFQGSGNVARRVFTMWQRWDGRNFCGVSWPNGDNIGIYNASGNIVENAIAYGRSLTGIFYQANADTVSANNNRILGSISALNGKNYDGKPWTYWTGQSQPTSRPGPTSNPYSNPPGQPCDSNVVQWEWGYLRTGLSAWGQGTLQNNLFSDSVALDNMGVGVSFGQPYSAGTKSGNQVDRVTSIGNFTAGYPSWEGTQGGNISIRMSGVQDPTNSKIVNSAWANGPGAALQYRYQDGKATNVPLLPWPMEGRAQAELGLSINAVVETARTRMTGAAVTWPAPTFDMAK